MIKLDHKLYNVPGILLGVQEGNQHIRQSASGLADVVTAKPINSEGLFRCGRITRLFTMGIVMRLVDKGAFDLDAPLEWVAAKHQQDKGLLKILVDQYPVLKPVTVRELLSDTSGLPAFDKTVAYNEIFTNKPRKVWQLENYLDVITGIDVRYQHGYKPGIRGFFSPSATNYMLAGLVIDAVSGHRTSEAMREVFQEFGLKHTHYLAYGEMGDDIAAQMIHGYLPVSHPLSQGFIRLPRVIYNENKELSVIDVTNAFVVNGMANGAAVSTTTDLITWFKQLVNAKVVASNYKQLFKEVQVKSFISNSKDYYCLGFYKSMFKDWGEILWSAGNSLGFGVLLAHSVKRDLTFCLVVNVSREHFNLHSEGLVADVLRKLLG